MSLLIIESIQLKVEDSDQTTFRFSPVSFLTLENDIWMLCEPIYFCNFAFIKRRPFYYRFSIFMSIMNIVSVICKQRRSILPNLLSLGLTLNQNWLDLCSRRQDELLDVKMAAKKSFFCFFNWDSFRFVVVFVKCCRDIEQNIMLCRFAKCRDFYSDFKKCWLCDILI